MDYAERLMRAGDRRAARRRLSRRDGDRRLSRRAPTRQARTCRSSSPSPSKATALTVDLTGTAPQVPDRPINMPLEGTVDFAIWLTIRSVLLDTAIHGHIPENAGLMRPITIVAPRAASPTRSSRRR